MPNRGEEEKSGFHSTPALQVITSQDVIAAQDHLERRKEG
jgi:hypothetical protein